MPIIIGTVLVVLILATTHRVVYKAGLETGKKQDGESLDRQIENKVEKIKDLHMRKLIKDGVVKSSHAKAYLKGENTEQEKQ